MGERLIIGDGLTFRRLYSEGVLSHECLAKLLTMTRHVAEKIAPQIVTSIPNIEICDGCCMMELASFMKKHREKFATTMAGASSLYYAQTTGYAIISEDPCMRRAARILGGTCYDVGQYIKMCNQININMMTG